MHNRSLRVLNLDAVCGYQCDDEMDADRFVAQTGLGNDGLKLLASALSATQLQTLTLNTNRIDDTGISVRHLTATPSVFSLLCCWIGIRVGNASQYHVA